MSITRDAGVQDTLGLKHGAARRHDNPETITTHRRRNQRCHAAVLPKGLRLNRLHDDFLHRPELIARQPQLASPLHCWSQGSMARCDER